MPSRIRVFCFSHDVVSVEEHALLLAVPVEVEIKFYLPSVDQEIAHYLLEVIHGRVQFSVRRLPTAVQIDAC